MATAGTTNALLPRVGAHAGFEPKRALESGACSKARLVGRRRAARDAVVACLVAAPREAAIAVAYACPPFAARPALVLARRTRRCRACPDARALRVGALLDPAFAIEGLPIEATVSLLIADAVSAVASGIAFRGVLRGAFVLARRYERSTVSCVDVGEGGIRRALYGQRRAGVRARPRTGVVVDVVVGQARSIARRAIRRSARHYRPDDDAGGDTTRTRSSLLAACVMHAFLGRASE